MYAYLPDAAAAVQRARAEVVLWEDLARRGEAMVINILEEEVSKGQRELLLRRTIRNGATHSGFDLSSGSLPRAP